MCAVNLSSLRENTSPKSFEGLLADITKQTSEMEKSRGTKDVIIDLINPDYKRIDSDVILVNTNDFNVQTTVLQVFPSLTREEGEKDKVTEDLVDEESEGF